MIRELMSRADRLFKSGTETNATYPFVGSDKIIYAIDGVSQFNTHYVIEVHSRLDVSCLSRAIDLALAKTPILKSVARLRPFAPSWEVVQGVASDSILTVRELSSETDVERAAEELIDEFINRRIDITRSPPARFLLIRLSPERWVFIVKTHHCPFDGAALFHLTRDIREYYEALLDGEPIAPSDQMGERSRRRLLRSVSPFLWSRAISMAIWRKMRHPRPGRKRFIWFSARTGSEGISYRSLKFDGEDYAAFRSRCQSLGATANDFILAALCCAIYKWNGSGEPADAAYSFVMPVDLRRYAMRNGKVPRIMSSFVGGTEVRVPAKAAATLQESVKYVTRETRFIKTHHLALLPNLIFPLLYFVPPIWLRGAVRSLYERRPSRLVPTSVVSNLGKADAILPPSPRFDIYRIEAVGTAYAPAGLFVAPMSYLQRQTITITYRRDVCPQEEIDEFVQIFSQELLPHRRQTRLRAPATRRTLTDPEPGRASRQEEL